MTTSQRKYYVYVLREPLTNVVRYVGVTVNPVKRMKAHLKDKSANAKARWVTELKKMELTPVLDVLVSFDTIKEAAEEEQRLYNIYVKNSLVCGNPAIYRYKVQRGRLTKPTGPSHVTRSDVRDFIIDSPEISIQWLARKMWPNNKDAKTYLGKKLSGERPFTEKDAEKARKALHELGHKLIGLT